MDVPSPPDGSHHLGKSCIKWLSRQLEVTSRECRATSRKGAQERAFLLLHANEHAVAVPQGRVLPYPFTLHQAATHHLSDAIVPPSSICSMIDLPGRALPSRPEAGWDTWPGAGRGSRVARELLYRLQQGRVPDVQLTCQKAAAGTAAMGKPSTHGAHSQVARPRESDVHWSCLHSLPATKQRRAVQSSPDLGAFWKMPHNKLAGGPAKAPAPFNSEPASCGHTLTA